MRASSAAAAATAAAAAGSKAAGGALPKDSPDEAVEAELWEVREELREDEDEAGASPAAAPDSLPEDEPPEDDDADEEEEDELDEEEEDDGCASIRALRASSLPGALPASSAFLPNSQCKDSIRFGGERWSANEMEPNSERLSYAFLNLMCVARAS